MNITLQFVTPVQLVPSLNKIYIDSLISLSTAYLNLLQSMNDTRKCLFFSLHSILTVLLFVLVDFKK